jgi:hypothetical protein
MTKGFVLVMLAALSTFALAQRAYGPINFGDSVAEVAAKLVTLEEVYVGARPITADSRDPEAILRWQSKYVTIDGHRFYLEFEFYDGKLFRLRMDSAPQTANYFDTAVASARAALVDVISTSHGPSSRTHSVSFLDMRSGFVQWTNVWDTNPDGVAYKVGLGEGEHRYRASLWIEWTWLRDLHDEAVSNQEREREGDVRSRF